MTFRMLTPCRLALSRASSVRFPSHRAWDHSMMLLLVSLVLPLTPRASRSGASLGV